MSEEEKIAERLREYFWDEEALTAALGSVEGARDARARTIPSRAPLPRAAFELLPRRGGPGTRGDELA